VLSLEQWVLLEKEIHERCGLDVNVFDPNGYRITDFKNWANRLCPAIKDTDKGQSFICAVAHMNLAAEARQTRKPVIEECDAGLLKLVVPIFTGNQFLGAVGACGYLLEDGEIDAFLVNKITEIDEGTVEDLSEGIRSITREEAMELARYIQERIRHTLAENERNSSP